jgi:hypothetical protein
MASWNDPGQITDADFIVAIWADSEYIDTNILTAYLNAANDVCAAFAPSLVEGATIPDSWKIAEILQAKHIWSRARSGNRDSIGGDGYEISTYPLVLEARGLLRPKRSPLKGLL